MSKQIKIFILLWVMLFPAVGFGQEKKSMPVVVGTALSPLLLGGTSAAYDPSSFGWVNGIFIITPFLITTVPMISHAYIGDNMGGIKYSLIKSIGMINWLTMIESDYCGENNPTCWYVSGSISGAIVVGTYIYEIIDLIKKTNKINEETADKVSLGFYSGVNRNRFDLGLSLTF